MTKPAVKPHPGVHRRSDSNIFQFGLRAPVDLLGHFPNKWAVRTSLGTSDLRQANAKAVALQAEWARKFEALRTGKPEPLDLHALRAGLLRWVENYLLRADLRHAKMPAEALDEAASDLEWFLGDARQGLVQGYVPDWSEDMLNGWAKKFGCSRSAAFDAEAMPFLVLFYELDHESRADRTRTFPLRVQRLSAKRALLGLVGPVETISSVKKSGTKERRIADALHEWLKAGNRPLKTISTFTRHAGLFATLMDDPALETLDKKDGRSFRNKLSDWARDNGRTAETADTNGDPPETSSGCIC